MTQTDIFGQGMFDVTPEGGQLQFMLEEQVDSGPSSALSDARQSIDDLILTSRRYRESKTYQEFLDFVSDMRDLAPFNAAMVDIQMPGARHVLSAHEWLEQHRHVPKPNAQPLVILHPFSPLRVVFDVSDVEPLEGARPLPADLVSPLRVRMEPAIATERLAHLRSNAMAYGIRVQEQVFGSNLAGRARRSTIGGTTQRPGARNKGPEEVRLRYEVTLNGGLDSPTMYLTLLHEIAHIMCGHLGTVCKDWWPDRRGASKEVVEIEAELVAYLVAKRQDALIEMPPYLDGYVKAERNMPPISLDRVLKAANVIDELTQRGRVATRVIKKKPS
ncbi:hypothetical protein [Kineosporia sp. NBRC 101731]|uniref:hypothetical protein n=1 Tax=Kineosporia sp. NBRC 101731 TaxID=3032199 RepID=UPI0024A05FAB|nr:hypothetical protein [Kineosporia sp. NBRC 101731]GLY32520.1 hypothetical protein Kisp02_58850 [Kineosporia sp. NBRC 101731]